MPVKAKSGKARKPRLKERDLTPRKEVKGGATPKPGGPIPIPYPN